ncbi:hypothetical protein KCU73_g24, partial [Aureobasidium melanogenum]
MTRNISLSIRRLWCKIESRKIVAADQGPTKFPSLRIAPQHTVPYHITAAVVPAMDADTAASRGQETTHESDSVLEDIGLLFKDSVDKPTIRCWNEAEICEIIHDNHETVQLVSRGDASWPAYTATFNRHLLTRVSPYFRALLEGGFSESTKKILPVDSDAYELRIFEKRLSTGSIEVEYHWYIDMVYLYKFADYYDIPALRREVMSELVKQARKQRGFWLASVAVEHLPSSSPLYRFFVEEFVQHANDIFHGGYELVTKEFLSLIFTGLAKRSADNPCRCCHNPCDFHDHDSEEEWEKSESCLLGRCRSCAYHSDSMSRYPPGVPKARSFYVSQATHGKTALNEQECLSVKYSPEERIQTRKGKQRRCVILVLRKRR